MALSLSRSLSLSFVPFKVPLKATATRPKLFLLRLITFSLACGCFKAFPEAAFKGAQQMKVGGKEDEDSISGGQIITGKGGGRNTIKRNGMGEE